MKKLLLATAAFVALSAPAFAQDKSGTTYTPQPMSRTSTTTSTTAAQPVYTPTASTETTYNNDMMGSGLYLGAYGGYGWTDADTAVGDADVDGADYGGFVGYKLDHFLQNNLGMGITGAVEAYYGDSNADDTVAGVSVEKNNEWGVNFRPGLSFLNYGTSINPYAILGYRRTEFEASAGGVSDSAHYNGFDLGIGTELVTWNNIGMRVDYTHTFYKENNGIDPDENDIRVGLAYHFQ